MATLGIAETTGVAGIAIFGVATGLDPALLIAGFAGGLWAQSYSEPAHWGKRVALTTLSSVLAGYFAPAGASMLSASETVRTALPGHALQLPVAVLVGLLAHRVLGPAIMKIARKKSEGLTK